MLHAEVGSGRPLDLAAIATACAAGDVTARRVVREAGRAVGLVVATLVGTLNVRHIGMAGPIVQPGEPLLDVVRQEMVGRSLADLARDTRVDFSTIGADVTAQGAAAVLLHEALGISPVRVAAMQPV